MTQSTSSGPNASPAAPPVPRLKGLSLAVAAARSAATYLLVGLYILLVGPPALLVGFLFKWPAPLFVLSHGGIRLGFAIAGIRHRAYGLERIPRGRPVVFCANHVSNVDAPLLFALLHPRLLFLMKAEFNKVPILGRGARMAGFIPVERQNSAQAQEAVDQGAQALGRGATFLVFPEGTRSRTGDLLPFKKGGFIMAIKAQVPIVPVAVEGGRAAMAKGSAVIRPVLVTVRIGQPIETTGLTLDDRDELVARARAQIEDMLRAPGRVAPILQR